MRFAIISVFLALVAPVAAPSLFSTGFEAGDPQPVWSASADGVYHGGKGMDAFECCVRTNGPAYGGTRALLYYGLASGAKRGASRSCELFEFSKTAPPITPHAFLRYWIYPEQDAARYAALDIVFADGSTLSRSACVDQSGFPSRASAGHGGELPINAWSAVTIGLGAESGKRIRSIRLAFDDPGASGPYRGYLDDIQISD